MRYAAVNLVQMEMKGVHRRADIFTNNSNKCNYGTEITNDVRVQTGSSTANL